MSTCASQTVVSFQTTNIAQDILNRFFIQRAIKHLCKLLHFNGKHYFYGTKWNWKYLMRIHRCVFTWNDGISSRIWPAIHISSQRWILIRLHASPRASSVRYGSLRDSLSDNPRDNRCYNRDSHDIPVRSSNDHHSHTYMSHCRDLNTLWCLTNILVHMTSGNRCRTTNGGHMDDHTIHGLPQPALKMKLMAMAPPLDREL